MEGRGGEEGREGTRRGGEGGKGNVNYYRRSVCVPQPGRASSSTCTIIGCHVSYSCAFVAPTRSLTVCEFPFIRSVTVMRWSVISPRSVTLLWWCVHFPSLIL